MKAMIRLPDLCAHCPECDFIYPEHSARCSNYTGEPLKEGEVYRDCYTCAGMFMMVNFDNPAILCHGEVINNADQERLGELCQHAWVEIPAEATMVDEDTGREWTEPITVVVDKTQPQKAAWFMPAQIFYKLTGARNVKRYDFRAMMENALRHGTDGPWPEAKGEA
jgi:hypothetical protein